MGHRCHTPRSYNPPELYRLSPSVGPAGVLGNLGWDEHGPVGPLRPWREDLLPPSRRQHRGRKRPCPLLCAALFHHTGCRDGAYGNPFLEGPERWRSLSEQGFQKRGLPGLTKNPEADRVYQGPDRGEGAEGGGGHGDDRSSPGGAGDHRLRTDG